MEPWFEAYYRVRTESIVIILGGNDLDNANGARVAGDRTASGLIALAQILRKWTPANDVYICGILPRLKPRSVDPSDYAQAVQSCNDTLQLLLNGSDLNQQPYPGVHFFGGSADWCTAGKMFFYETALTLTIWAISGYTITFNMQCDLLWGHVNKDAYLTCLTSPCFDRLELPWANYGDSALAFSISIYLVVPINTTLVFSECD